MKKIFRYFPLFLIIIIIGCKEEESSLEISHTSLTINYKAKSWFDSQENSQLRNNLEFHGTPDWENFFQIENEIYFPIISKLENNETIEVNQIAEGGENVYVKPYLILNKIDENNFEESLKVFFTANGEDFQPDYKSNDLSFVHYDSNNMLKEYFLKEGIEDDFSNSKNEEILITGSGIGCSQYFVVATTQWSDGSTTYEVIFSYEVCLGGGAGGGSGGGSGFGQNSPFNEFLGEVTITPPSCTSFKFESVGSNWQSAAVTGFQFGVGTLLADGNITVYRIRDYINQTVLFETWKEDRFGNIISAGAAAELSAAALNDAIKATAHQFKDKYGFSQTQVRLWFENKLKNVYSDMTDGGRITFRNNRYNQIPSQYRTTLFGSDNCD